MYNQIRCAKLIEEFNNSADERFQSLKSNLKFAEAMKEGNSTEVSKFANLLKELLISVIPEGLPIPKAYMYVSSMSNGGDAISVINITVSNKSSSEKEFRFSTSIIGDDVAEKVFNFLKPVYATLLEDEMAQENVDLVNHVVSQAAEEAGLGYKINFVTPMVGKGKKIVQLTDDEITLACDMDRLMNIDNMVIFQTEPNEDITEEYIQETYTSLCNALAQAQTPVQLVEMHGGELISLLCDLSKRVKAMTLISKVYNKNILTMKGDKDGIGYYNKDNIFAVVSRKSGALEVILNPISTKTLEPVEFDVIDAIRNI